MLPCKYSSCTCDFRQIVTAHGQAVATIYKVQGAGNSEHSIAEGETVAFAEHINRTLGQDKFLASRLPMDPNTDELFKQCADGIIFAKLVSLSNNHANPNMSIYKTQFCSHILFCRHLSCAQINMVDSEAIDERALNLKVKLSKFQQIENCNLAINAAKAIGCQITNIGASDLIEGRAHLGALSLAQLRTLTHQYFATSITHTHINIYGRIHGPCQFSELHGRLSKLRF